MDLVTTLQELNALDVGFVSLCEALDLTTASSRALAGMLAVFAEFKRDILRDCVKAGIDQARKQGRPHGRLRASAAGTENVVIVIPPRRSALSAGPTDGPWAQREASLQRIRKVGRREWQKESGGVLSQEMRAKLVEDDTVALLVHVFSPYIQCCLVFMA